MSYKIFEVISVRLEGEINKRVNNKLRERFKEYAVNLNYDGKLRIEDKFGTPIKNDELEAIFNLEIYQERNRIISDIMAKLGYPIKE